MRTLAGEEVQCDFDQLLDSLEEQGPIRLAMNGKDIAIMMPSKMYDDYVQRRAAADSRPSQQARPVKR